MNPEQNWLMNLSKVFFNDLKRVEDSLNPLSELFCEGGSSKVHYSDSLSDTIYGLLKDFGIPESFKEVLSRIFSEDLSTEQMALQIALRIFNSNYMSSPVENISLALRAACIFLTEGRITMEGIGKISIDPERNFLIINYEGPIRAFGGTACALSLFLVEELRKEAKLEKYVYSEREIHRWIEEISLYNSEHARLQYYPPESEIRCFIENCPIYIHSSGLQTLQVPRAVIIPEVSHPFVRGGCCLVIGEGVCAKIPKIKNFVRKNNLEGWDTFLEKIETLKTEKKLKSEEELSSSFIVGRPVFAFDDLEGSFRAVFGRTRFCGMLSMAISPTTSALFNKFLGFGTQFKMSWPSKGGLCTFSNDLESPFVRLRDGRRLRLNSQNEHLISDVVAILDCGEILISPGDVFHQKKKITKIPRSQIEFRLKCEKLDLGFESYEDSQKAFENGVGDHPDFIPFFQFLSIEQFHTIRNLFLSSGFFFPDKIIIPSPSEDFVNLFEKLLIPFEITSENIFQIPLNGYGQSIMKYFFLEQKEGYFIPSNPLVNFQLTEEYFSHIFNKKVIFKEFIHLGVRMGRPEKAAVREKTFGKLSPHGLIGARVLDSRRNLLNCSKQEKITGKKYICKDCTHEPRRPTVFRVCDVCGKKTIDRGLKTKMSYLVNWKNVFERSMERNGLSKEDFPKGVKGNEMRYPNALEMEDIEKVLFKAKNNIKTFRDGTCRFDLTNGITTQFIPREIGVSLETIRRLGYSVDINEDELVSDNQMVHLFPQDIILSKEVIPFFQDIDNYIQEYAASRGLESSTFVGRYVVVMAPHTCLGQVARVIGYIDPLICLQHPLLLASKRRNADGDEDSIMDFKQLYLDYDPDRVHKKLGSQMDTPINVVKSLNPKEVDSEGKSIFSAPTFEETHLDSLKSGSVEFLSDFNTFEEIKPLLFTHSSVELDGEYNRVSIYKSDTTMDEKLETQLNLLYKMKYLDKSKVLQGVINNHLIPDIVGNMRKYFKQSTRCTKCKRSQDVFTISGNCVCGNKLIPTIHPAGIIKYVPLIEKLISEGHIIDTYLLSKFSVLKEELWESF